MGVPLTLCRLDSKQHRHAVIEAGINEPGEMETLASMIQADCVLITMVGASHLAKLRSLECVARQNFFMLVLAG